MIIENNYLLGDACPPSAPRRWGFRLPSTSHQKHYLCSPMLHKIISAFIGIIFIAFAAVQYNDPDPIQWMATYGIVAAIGFIYIRTKLPSWFLLILLAGCIIWAVIIFPDEFGGITENMEEVTGIEETREVLGLAIAGAALLYFVLLNRKKN